MKLPILDYKDSIIEAVLEHSVTIISAETGSGKSTQIPQFLAKYYDKIVVTEPRIMAAKTLAKRVSQEMGVTLGKEVGYRTGYDKCASFDSNIVYCTDGLQLVRTIFSENKQAENVLIIDEVHEWNLNIETLIAWCKYMQGNWNTKVVIMSATMDTAKLADFFGEDVAVLNIPGTMYEVEVEERSKYEFIDTILEEINNRKNILVFVAGKKEIADVIDKLDGTDATILPLHGELDWEEQKRCFENYPNSKVVVATNVAQTSLTIPDIDVVVDSGEARISIARNGIQGLFLENISIADIMQRKGRAGRTKSGKYILCSDWSIENRQEYTIPEIQRSILDRVVLQMAEIGLDAEKLKFYHQPDIDAILNAKSELSAIGAFSNNKVTELGHRIVKIPVSVQFARMIVEAEKYGVTEQVMTIAAIIEMGGLLTKSGKYYNFTKERGSDLLAELDVWNYINRREYTNTILYRCGFNDREIFNQLGINRKNFFKIREHIQKLRETLYGIVEMSSNDDKEAIVKSCLSGLVSHIYVRRGSDFYSEDGSILHLDRNSCVSEYSNIVIGIPKTIEFKTRYGGKSSLKLISFASQIDAQTLLELVPDSVHEETTLRYSNSMDAVEITTTRTFAGIVIDTEVNFDRNHPQYFELKTRYENDLRRYNSYPDMDNPANEQEVIVIDGKQFKLHTSYYSSRDERKVVYLDNETLFTTETKEVILDSGKKVYFSSEMVIGRKETNIVALKNAVETKRISQLRERKVSEYSRLQVSSIDDVIENSSKLGEIYLTMNNGGYGDTPIFVYGYISLSKNTVTFKIGDDKEIASSSTREALQYLFLKEVEKRYGESKFSHQVGKKKKILTEAEMEMKKDFDALVREVMLSLTVQNASENLEFLEKYYQELMQ